MESDMEEFMSLMQQGTVNNYLDTFETLLNKVRVLEDFYEDKVVYCFILGLKPEIGDFLKGFHNVDKSLKMEEAVSMARLCERIINSGSRQGRDMIELKAMVKSLQKRHINSSNQMKVESAHQVFEEMPKRVGEDIQEISATNDEVQEVVIDTEICAIIDDQNSSQRIENESVYKVIDEIPENVGTKIVEVLGDDASKNKNNNRKDVFHISLFNDTHKNGALNHDPRESVNENGCDVKESVNKNGIDVQENVTGEIHKNVSVAQEKIEQEFSVAKVLVGNQNREVHMNGCNHNKNDEDAWKTTKKIKWMDTGWVTMALSVSDLPAIYTLLSNSFSSDESIRKHAESTLAQSENLPGFCSCLMEVIGAKDLVPQAAFRLMASLYFKNSITRYWRNKCDSPGITSEVKSHLRQKLLFHLIEGNYQIALTLAVLISKIARIDYLKEWPEFFSVLAQQFQSADILTSHRSATTVQMSCWDFYPAATTASTLLLLFLASANANDGINYKDDTFAWEPGWQWIQILELQKQLVILEIGENEVAVKMGIG